MRVDLHLTPFTPAVATMKPTRNFTIDELLCHPDIEFPEARKAFAVVEIGGHEIDRSKWNKVRIKHRKRGVLKITIVPQGPDVGRILATVATIAAVAAIGTFGLPFLGIAAGTFGASLAAAGVGIAGQLLATALSAPPALANDQGGTARQTIVAGISNNAPVLNDTLPVGLGKIGFSPPILMPAYSNYRGGTLTATGIVGLQGRYLIENIRINDVPSDQVAGLTIETREGSAGDLPRTIGTDTVLDQKLNLTLSEFTTAYSENTPHPLLHQPLDTDDVPQWHSMKTAGDADDFTLRFFAPSGFVKSNAPTDDVTVPVRIQIRPVGSSTWRNLPELHFQDPFHGQEFRAEVRIKFTAELPGGRLLGRNSRWNIWDATNIAGQGDTYEYDADPYFIGASTLSILAGTSPGWINNFNATGATTSGMTVSASSTNGTNSPWKAFDGATNGGTIWRSASTGGPHTLRVDFTSAKTIMSYYIIGIATSTSPDDSAPTRWRFQGSNDNGVTWINLDDDPIDVSSPATLYNLCNVQHPASYTSYQWVIDQTNADTSYTAVALVQLFSVPASCSSADVEIGSTPAGQNMYHSGLTNSNRVQNFALDQDGCTVYLDPAQWTPGEYEVRVMRGMAFPSDDLNPLNYNISLNPVNGFFDYQTKSTGILVVAYGFYYHADLQIELIQTHQAVAPFNPQGVAMIAFTVADIVVDSIYAEFTRYAPIWDGSVWTELEYPTKNPAALYRQLLLGAANPNPMPGELIDEDELIAWYEACEASGYECNAVVQGTTLEPVKQLIASAGYASPRNAALYGVVRDYDTSDEVSVLAISPMNSRDLGTTIAIAKIPDAIIANFANEEKFYAQDSVTVYRDGFDQYTAKNYQAITYAGTTNATKVAARAAYDLKALHVRQERNTREVSYIGYKIKRGSIVKLSDDVLDHNQSYARIRTVLRDGGNVVGLELNNVIALSRQTEFSNVEDVTTVTDVLNVSQPMGLCFEFDPDNEHQLSNATDSNVVMFTTPVADDPQNPLIRIGGMVITGNLTNIGTRKLVMSWVPSGIDTFQIELADEGNSLFSS